MGEKLDYNDFIPLLGAWAEKFRPFIEGEQMFNIYQKLKKDGSKEIICPDSDKIFRAFSCSSPDDVKSVWYMMDPYAKRYKSGVKQATGIAMDCSNTPDGKLQPSLEKFYEGMSKDLGRRVEHSSSLEYLCNQGVLMLNTELTCKLNKTGSHEGLWEPFHSYFLKEIMGSYSGIVYVLAGKVSQRMEKHIYPISNYIFKMDHPVSASYKNTDWDCKRVFSRTNQILEENNKTKITWDRREWDEEAPF